MSEANRSLKETNQETRAPDATDAALQDSVPPDNASPHRHGPSRGAAALGIVSALSALNLILNLVNAHRIREEAESLDSEISRANDKITENMERLDNNDSRAIRAKRDVEDKIERLTSKIADVQCGAEEDRERQKREMAAEVSRIDASLADLRRNCHCNPLKNLLRNDLSADVSKIDEDVKRIDEAVSRNASSISFLETEVNGLSRKIGKQSLFDFHPGF